MDTKHISTIALPGITAPAEVVDNTPVDAEYLNRLKALVDEKVETLEDKEFLGHSYKRDEICTEAKHTLQQFGSPTLEELNHCFPGCDHTEWIRKCEEGERRRNSEQAQVGKPPQRTSQVPTRQEVGERLENPPEPESDEIKLSESDWEWIQKANHPLGGRLFYGAVVTPQFMELDLELGISESPHRRRLLDFLSLHCDKTKGITTGFSVEELARKMQCGKDKIRESIKWLVKRGVLEYSERSKYPSHYTERVSFKIPSVVEVDQTKYHAHRIAKRTDMSYRELWERREEFGYGVKGGGEAEGEGVRPPSSS